MVATWDSEFARVSDMQKKLALLYLANDVLQNSRKRGPQFVQEFYRILPKAIRHMLKHGDASVCPWPEAVLLAPVILLEAPSGVLAAPAATGSVKQWRYPKAQEWRSPPSSLCWPCATHLASAHRCVLPWGQDQVLSSLGWITKT